MMRWRSALFVPGDAPVKIAKAAGQGGDAVIIDLEDGASPSNRPEARAAMASSVAMVGTDGVAVAVRINGGWREALKDLDACILPGVAALVIPKAEEPGRLAVLGEMIGELELDRGLPRGAISLIALIETAVGVANCGLIAKAPRVVGLALGSEDLSLSLGVAPSPRLLELPVRQIALAGAAAGVMALAVPISIAALRDEKGWRAATAEARAVGATGALCIHPLQVAIANATFAPTPKDLLDARLILAAWEKGGGPDTGVMSFNGRMIDRPVAERARRMLEIDKRP